MRALSKGVPEAATSSQRQRRGSGNEHLGSTRPSTWPRDGDTREQRLDAALDVLGAACTSMGKNKNRLHQTCRPVNQCIHVCVEKCLRHTAGRSGDSCGVSQRLSFGGSAPQQAEAGHRERSGPRSGPQREQTRADLGRRAGAAKLWKH